MIAFVDICQNMLAFDMSLPLVNLRRTAVSGNTFCHVIVSTYNVAAGMS